MSGGSWDYLYIKVQDAAERLMREDGGIERMAFAHVLSKVATALHDIEWVDSGDYGRGDELNAIKQVVPAPEMFTACLMEAAVATERLLKAMQELSKYGTDIQKFGNLNLPMGGPQKQ